jgi:Fe2+ transport system protein FeoA
MIAPAKVQETLLPLDFLKSNEEAHVVELVGDPRQIHRLEEMGLRVGAAIRMVRPGAPCLLALDGKRISIRFCGVDVLVATSTIPA